MSMVHKFANSCLEEITYPSKAESWHVQGMLKNKSNQIFKFDVRPMKVNNNRLEKQGYFKSKADKMVFDTKDEWVIVDIEELYQYLKENKIKEVYLQSLISKLDWNIILPK
jgi:hypothetical protein